MAKQHLQRLVGNIQPKLIRHDTMEGKDYLVAPMVMLTEGVHQGSSGPLLYPASELSKIPAVWNHKPVVVYHPEVNGQGVSACDPDVLTNRKIGVIMKTRFEDNKLKAEAWLEKSRVDAVDDRIAEAIENNSMMELSTGLYTDLKEEEGDWNGTPYSAIAVNYRPDHLAVLPDQIGACSMADGAGFLRMNTNAHLVTMDVSNFTAEQSSWIGDNLDSFTHTFLPWATTLIDNELSHGTIRDRLRLLVATPSDDMGVWIEEVYDDDFIFEKENKLYRQGYTVKKDVVKLSGVAELVERVVEYKSVNIISNRTRKEQTMDKQKFIDGLIANKATLWSEDDRESLMAMNEEVLQKMDPVMEVIDNAAADAAAAVAAAAEAGAAEADAAAAPTGNEAATVDEYIAKAPPEFQGVLRNGLASYEAEKIDLITKITANTKCLFTKEVLATKDVSELRNLAALAVEPKPATPQPSYAGNQGVVPVVDNGQEEEALDVPSLC